jgi:hypothetical protein
MNATILSRRLGFSLLLAASVFSYQGSASAQNCLLDFPAGGSPAVINISAPWDFETYPQTATAYFNDVVTTGNAEVAAGNYLGWCVDVPDPIGAASTSYSALMFSSCDTNLDAELQALGYQYPGSVYVSPLVWNEINYILNNKNGATFYDIQVAIWTLIGGPIDPEEVVSPPFPPWTQSAVNQLLAAAVKNAPLWKWQPQPGNVIAVVVAEITGSEPPVQLTIIEVPVPNTQTVCCNLQSQNCYGGSVWCNAHLTCSPHQACTVYCQNNSVTFTCNNGQTFTYAVPDCQVNFSSKCSTPSCSYQGGKWATSVPCSGDDQIFLSGCGIPWRSEFSRCSSICWTGTFSCSTPGVNCQWQCGASCYNANLSNCNALGVKPCHTISCGFGNGDNAGTPENCKSSCWGFSNQYNQGGNNYCGSWSGYGSFTSR